MVGNGNGSGPDYRNARQASAGVLIGLVSIIVLGGVLNGRPIDVTAMLALLATAAGLLAVDLPNLRR